MMRRYHIVEGDKTTADGVVQPHTGSGATFKWHGKTKSYVGDKVLCKDCQSVGVIQASGSRLSFLVNGLMPALNDDLCVCKCSPPPKLVHSQTVFFETVIDITSKNNTEKLKSATELVDVDYQTQLVLVNEKENILDKYHYKIEFSDGTSIEGITDSEGKTEVFDKSKELANLWYQINKGIEV